jgi:Region found in RelA / SpoT proteins
MRTTDVRPLHLLQMKQLIEFVQPFDQLAFKSHGRVALSGAQRRGLDTIDRCGRQLLQELQLNGCATGLEINVQASGNRLASDCSSPCWPHIRVGRKLVHISSQGSVQMSRVLCYCCGFRGVMSCKLQGRLKSLYSIHKKMQRKNVGLAEIYDARALRVVIDDGGDRQNEEAIIACYQVRLQRMRCRPPHRRNCQARNSASQLVCKGVTASEPPADVCQRSCAAGPVSCDAPLEAHRRRTGRLHRQPQGKTAAYGAAASTIPCICPRSCGLVLVVVR